jgi:aspartate dehydrogenase
MHLGLVGYGNIGRTLTGLLQEAPVARITVLVRAAYREAVAGELKDSPAAGRIEVTGEVGALVAARPDVVVECAGQGALAEFGPVILQAGIPVIAASVGALADEAVEARLRTAAEAGETQVVLPAGAIGGVDLLAALAAAGGLSVSYR